MKLLTIALLSTVSLGSLISASSHATNYKFIATDSHPSTLLCAAAGNNKLRQYRAHLREFRLRNRFVANNISCNGYNIAEFAINHHALHTAKHINRYRTNKVSITDLALNKGPKKLANDG